MTTTMDIAAVLSALIYPTIAIIALIAFRKPIIGMASVLGGRIQRISFAGISLEIAELSQMKPAGIDTEIRSLEAAPMVQSGASSLTNLLTELAQGSKQEYIVIDLGSETTPRWLTSRLYLLAFLITSSARSMPLVFVETMGITRGRLIGTASPDRVRRALARNYDWLEMAIYSSFVNLGTIQLDAKTGFLVDWQTSQLIQNFLSQIRIIPAPVPAANTPPDANTEADWILLPKGVQEHAKWVDGARLERLLGGDLLTSHVVLQPNKSSSDLMSPVMMQSGQFVAVVDTDRKFLSLIDRMRILEGLAPQLAKQMKQNET